MKTKKVSGGKLTGGVTQQWTWVTCGDLITLASPATAGNLVVGGSGAKVVSGEGTAWNYTTQWGLLQDVESGKWGQMIKKKSMVKLSKKLKYLKGTDKEPWAWFQWTVESVEPTTPTTTTSTTTIVCDISAPFLIKNRSPKTKTPYLTMNMKSKKVSGGKKTGLLAQQWKWVTCGSLTTLASQATGGNLKVGGSAAKVTSGEGTAWNYTTQWGLLQDVESGKWGQMIKKKSLVKLSAKLKYIKGTNKEPWGWFQWTLESVEATTAAPTTTSPVTSGTTTIASVPSTTTTTPKTTTATMPVTCKNCTSLDGQPCQVDQCYIKQLFKKCYPCLFSFRSLSMVRSTPPALWTTLTVPSPRGVQLRCHLLVCLHSPVPCSLSPSIHSAFLPGGWSRLLAALPGRGLLWLL